MQTAVRVSWRLFNDYLVLLGKPMLSNFASGHGFFKAAVPIGASIHMDTLNRTITLLEPAITYDSSSIE
jgi:muramoyltetrapeptide carboxypeptidase